MTMQTCESCGTRFDDATLKGEVVSARILCQVCSDKRRAQKAAASRPGAVSSPAPAAAGAAAAARAPAPAPRATARAMAAGAAPTPRGTSGRGAATVEAHDSGGGRHKPREYGKHAEDLESDGKTVMIGWSIAGIFLVVGLVVLFFVLNTHKTEDQRKADLEAARKEHIEKIKSLDNAGDPDALVAYIESKPEFFKDADIGAAVHAALHKGKKDQVLFKERKDVQDVWDREIKANLPALASLSSEQMLKMLNVIRQDIAPNESKMTDAFRE